MPIARQCMMCRVVYGHHDVPEDGISHGLCESPLCLQAFIGDDTIEAEVECKPSSSSSTLSVALSSAQRSTVSSLPPSS